jgi:hypothetical protein
MSEIIPTPQGAESLAERQARVFAFVKRKFDEAVNAVASQEADLNRHNSHSYKSHPEPVFPGPVVDGGMDIQDRIVEKGSWEQEQNEHDYYTSSDAEKELKGYKDDVADLHEAMTLIENGDEETISKYEVEMEK